VPGNDTYPWVLAEVSHRSNIAWDKYSFSQISDCSGVWDVFEPIFVESLHLWVDFYPSRAQDCQTGLEMPTESVVY
jgi:hypothetical protein